MNERRCSTSLLSPRRPTEIRIRYEFVADKGERDAVAPDPLAALPFLLPSSTLFYIVVESIVSEHATPVIEGVLNRVTIIIVLRRGRDQRSGVHHLSKEGDVIGEFLGLDRISGLEKEKLVKREYKTEQQDARHLLCRSLPANGIVVEIVVREEPNARMPAIHPVP